MRRIPREDNKKYEEKTAVRVVARQVFYDDGHRIADKGEIIKVDDVDMALLLKAKQVSKKLVEDEANA